MAARRRDLSKHRNYGLLREYKATLVTRERMSRLGTHGVGIGRKEVGAERTDTLALLFYVARKQPVARLSAERIPESVTFYSRKAQREFRLPTDVIETPPVQFEQDPEARIRPVPGGVSFGISGSTGTLGGWVWDETDDTIVCLSNNHVLGNTVGADTSSRAPRSVARSPPTSSATSSLGSKLGRAPPGRAVDTPLALERSQRPMSAVGRRATASRGVPFHVCPGASGCWLERVGRDELCGRALAIGRAGARFTLAVGSVWGCGKPPPDR